jgi:predicted MFS family arabinose efflux permease
LFDIDRTNCYLNRMTIIEQSYRMRIIYVRLGILAAGLFVVGTNAFVIAGVLPAIAASLHVSTSAVSYSITFYAIVVAIASPAISILLARLSRTRLMSAGLILIAIGTAVAALAPTLDLFNLGRIVAAFGGAALVPAATAAAPAIMPVERRGRALAIAGLGFTLATAIGSPLGTALASIGGWRLPLLVLAGLALILAAAVAIVVRDIPVGAATSVARRFALLKDSRVLLALVATLLLTAGFNIVYIFSSAVTHEATGGSGTLLAVLLLIYGVGGVLGTTLAGRVTDRLGARATATAALAIEALVLVVLPLVAHSFVPVAVCFAIWGVAAFGAVVPVQHRLVSIDSASAPIALSWYSTAMYIGIAVAPVAGAIALSGGADIVPIAGALTAALALVAFQLGYLGSSRKAVVQPA